MAYIDLDNDPALHRLEGSSSNQIAGLIIMKKTPADTSNKHSFKKPSGSLLGLDKLAALKRKQDGLNAKEKKRSRIMSFKGEEEDDVDDGDSDSSDEDTNTRIDQKKQRYITSKQ